MEIIKNAEYDFKEIMLSILADIYVRLETKDVKSLQNYLGFEIQKPVFPANSQHIERAIIIVYYKIKMVLPNFFNHACKSTAMEIHRGCNHCSFGHICPIPKQYPALLDEIALNIAVYAVALSSNARKNAMCEIKRLMSHMEFLGCRPLNEKVI